MSNRRGFNTKVTTWSKKITITAVLIFVVCVAIAIKIPDSTLAVAIVSAGAAVLTMTFIFYFRKAQAENIPKIQTTYYRSIMKTRLDYNEKMMKLKNKYGTDEYDSDLDNSDIANASNNAVRNAEQRLSNLDDNANQIIDNSDISPI